MVSELRLVHADNGNVDRAMMGLRSFAGSLPPHIGADRTDISSMTAARELGGRGIGIGQRIAA